MSNTIDHVVLSDFHTPTAAPGETFRDLPFTLNRSGRVRVEMGAMYHTKGPPINHKPNVQHIPLSWILIDPKGFTLTGDVITRAMLDRFRDNRGALSTAWKLRILPVPAATVAMPGFNGVSEGPVRVTVTETIESLSGPPVIPRQKVLAGVTSQVIRFDLFRLGELRVKTTFDALGILHLPAKQVWLTLLDPNGVAKASGRDGVLRYRITDPDLGISRDAKGRLRPWSLKVEAGPGYLPPAGAAPHLRADVIGTVRVPASVLQSRLETLFGTTAPTMTLGSRWVPDRQSNLITLTLHDERTAETLGMHDVLDGLPRHLNAHDGNNPEVGVEYVLDTFTKSDDPVWGAFSWHLEVQNLRTTTIAATLMQSVQRTSTRVVPARPGSPNFGPGRPGFEVETFEVLPAGLPAIALAVGTQGSIRAAIDHHDDGEVVMRNIRIEVGFTTAPDGKLQAIVWFDPNSIGWGGAEGMPHGGGWVMDLLGDARDEIAAKVQKAFNNALPGLFDVFMGGRFDFAATRWNAATSSMEFDFIAGNEIATKPSPGYVPRGIRPGELPHHFASPAALANLQKVNHIVVLMMENRSFDHVLGYRSLPGGNAGVNGLTPDVIARFSKPSTDKYIDEGIRPLSQAAFSPKTKLPIHVGHSFTDVAEQLSGGTMTGFVRNVLRHYGQRRAELDALHVVPKDVMGYYTAADLPMYGYLADQFGIGDAFYCSHPGPTLPNRMYSLTGDLMIDRFGDRLQENGVGSDMRLSRAPTIVDLLSRDGVSWRVYESPPSVSMLRYFARYAGDDTNIRNINQFAADCAAGNLPAVTFIDPAYHYAPPNDDHPPADMLLGQKLVRDVYNALRSQPNNAFQQTLLAITYDEHGGLFDHVNPPVAEIWEDPQREIDRQTALEVVAEDPAPSRPVGPHTVPGRVDVPPLVSADPAPTHLPERVPPHLPLDTLPTFTPAYAPDITVGYGLRVPMFLVSPWVEPGSVHHDVWDHTSILQTIIRRFCASNPFLSDRVRSADHVGAALSRTTPRTDIPQPPPIAVPAAIRDVAMRQRFFRKADLTRQDADWHEFMTVLGRLTRGQ